MTVQKNVTKINISVPLNPYNKNKAAENPFFKLEDIQK